MTNPAKTPGRSRWKRLRTETPTSKRLTFRDTSAKASDITVLLNKDRLVIKMTRVKTGGTVILSGLVGNSARKRIAKVIKTRHDVKPETQAPAVAEPARSPDLAKFMSAFGILKEKSVFDGDAVAFQREMREEWR